MVAKTLVALFIISTAAVPADGRTSTFEIAKESLRAHVVLADRVTMVRPLAQNVDSNAAIRVQLSGNFPTIDVFATPAYGFSTKFGRAVFITLATSYRAAGDSQTAHPVYQGILIEPNPRSPIGHADVELPIGEHAALALTVTVPKAGYAKVSLRHPSDPARDLVVGGI